jgi:hypothetical protein
MASSLVLERPDLEVCGEAINGEEAVAKAGELKPRCPMNTLIIFIDENWFY